MAEWSSFELNCIGDADKLSAIHDSLKRVEKKGRFGPEISMEDFQSALKPEEEKKDFLGSFITGLEYRNWQGHGVLSFTVVNGWVDYDVAACVHDVLGSGMGLTYVSRYGSNGVEHKPVKGARIFPSAAHALDPRFVPAIRDMGKTGNKTPVYCPEDGKGANIGNINLGALLSDTLRLAEMTKALMFSLDEDGKVTMHVSGGSNGRLDMRLFTPEEQDGIFTRCFKLTQKQAVTVDWQVVEKDGKFNYVNGAGMYLAQEWFDDVTPFVDGKATVVRGDTRATINAEGIVLVRETVRKKENAGVKMS